MIWENSFGVQHLSKYCRQPCVSIHWGISVNLAPQHSHWLMGWASHLLGCLYHLPGRVGFRDLEALCWWQQHLSLYVCLISPLSVHGNSAQGFSELAQLQHFMILYLSKAILWKLIISKSEKNPPTLIIGSLVLSSPNYSLKCFELYIHSVDLNSCGAEIWHLLSHEA